MSIIEPDLPFRLRPRAPKRTDDSSRIWPIALRHVLVRVQTTCKALVRSQAPRNSRSAGVSRSFAQRCAVRVTYSPNRARGQWAAHGRYVVRERATEQDRQHCGFDAKSDRVDVVQTAADWQKAGDLRMFKLILSPEFGERLDLKELTRHLIHRMESDLRLPLEWVAVNHFNTEHPHTHVLLRSIAAAQELRLAREHTIIFIAHGVHSRGKGLCACQG